MSTLYPVPEVIANDAHINGELYKKMYAESVDDPDAFWSAQATTFLSWYSQWDEVSSANFGTGHVSWFRGATLNVCVNCVDRHLPERANQTALIWEGDDPSVEKRVSFQELHDEVCQLANALTERGVIKGDRVCIYMPMVLEAAYAMLACARLGAIHSVVFGGFSPQALKDRILDSDCRVLFEGHGTTAAYTLVSGY